MRNLLRTLARQAAQVSFLRNVVFSPLLKLADFVRRLEKTDHKPEPTPDYDKIRALFQNQIVRNGPFKGMIYPKTQAVGSSIYPKLLGSYERELHFVMNEICSRQYSEVLDVGCAEGYYAVGLAIRLNSAQVYAYDVDEKAIELCQHMAILNRVQDRVFLQHECKSQDLQKFEFSGKGLIISDCEGYEKILFTEQVAAKLKDHDLLIELHDFLDRTISSNLFATFKQTHDMHIITSLSDEKKVECYNYPELNGLDLDTKMAVLKEERPETMEWLYLQSKTSIS